MVLKRCRNRVVSSAYGRSWPRMVKCSYQSVMPEWGCPSRVQIKSLTRSLPRRLEAPVWDWRSPVPSSNRMAETFGLPPTPEVERPSILRCPLERLPPHDLRRFTSCVDRRRRYPHVCGDAALIEDGWSAFRVVYYAGGLSTAQAPEWS